MSTVKATLKPRKSAVQARSVATVEALHDATHEAQERTFRELDDVRNDLRATDLRLREDIRLSREAAEADRAGLRSRVEEAERRVAAVTRHFDQAVDGLTEQRELVSGIRAFVRLVRADAAAAGE